MSDLHPDPHPDPRRSEALFRDLQQRAQSWLPKWQGIAARADASARGDFARTFLQLAARINAEVTERLDQTPDKVALGMLDWLAIAARPGNAARMPVVLKARANGKQTVFAKAPLKFQVNTTGAPIPFESSQDIRVVPGALIRAAALDAAKDALYLPPPSLLRLEAPPALPTRWSVKSVVAQATSKSTTGTASLTFDRLQLDPPELGLDAGLWLQIGPAQYRIAEKAQGGLVRIDPPLPNDSLPQPGDTVRLVQTFAPFSGTARDLEAHYLYIGDENALNLTAPALIDLQGGQTLYGKCRWSYWGKADKDADPAWLPLEASLPDTGAENILRLNKADGGSAEIIDIAGRKTRWLRALADPDQVEATAQTFEGVQLKIQSAGSRPEDMPAMEAVSNTTSVVLNDRFYPFGKFPHQFDSFFLACKEVFSKPGARVTLTANIAGRTLGPAVGWMIWSNLIGTAAAGQDGNLHIFHAAPNAADAALFDWTLLGSFAPTSATADSDAGDAVNRFAGFSAALAPVKIQNYPYGGNLMLCLPAGKDVWAWSEPSVSSSKWSWLGTPAEDANVIGLAATGQVVWNSGASLLALLEGGKKVAVRPFSQTGRSWQLVTGLDDTEWSRIVPLLQANGVYGEQFGATDRALLLAADGSAIGILQAGSGAQGGTSGDTTGDTTGGTPGSTSGTGWRLVGKLACPEGWSGSRTPVAWQWQDGDQDRIYMALVVPGAAGADDAIGMAAWDSLSGNPDSPTEAAFDYRVECEGSVVGDAPGLAFSGQSFDYGSTPMWLACSVRTSGGTVSPAWTAVPKQAGSQTPVIQRDTVLPPATPGQNPIFIGMNLVVPGNSQDLMSDGFPPFRLRTVSTPSEQAGNGIVPSETLASDVWVQWQSEEPRLWTYTPDTQSPPLTPDNRQWLIGPDLPASGSALVIRPPSYYSNYQGKLVDSTHMRIPYGTFTPQEGTHLLLLSTQGSNRGYHVEITQVEIFQGRNEASFVELTFDAAVNETNHSEQWNAWELNLQNNEQCHPITWQTRAGIWLAAGNAAITELSTGKVLHDTSGSATPPDQTIATLTSQSANIGGTLVLFNTLWSELPQADSQGKINFSYDPGGSSKWSRYAVASGSAPDLSWEYWNGTGWWKIADTDDRTGDFRQSGQIIFTVPRDMGQTDVLGRQNFWIRARLVGGDYGRETYSLTDTTNPANAVTRAVTISTDSIHAPQITSLTLAYQLDDAIWPQTVLTQDTLSWLDQSLANRSPGALVSAFIPPVQRLSGMGAQQVGRSLFLAFQNRPEGGPVRIFFKVDEADLSACAPLKVEALADGRFVPVLADDDTRALGENGLLTLQFDQPPSQAELFGQTAYWLRLYPSDHDDLWTPSLQGAYLNAVWADAAQGRSMDVLGSSDASPNQSVKLVGAPVLGGSLELRVRETLGSEERAALLAQGVLVSDPAGFPGDWVLWQEVPDPADEAGDARVYAIDATAGVVRFGDGKHGAVPPLGRNNIVAFAWRRGGGAGANGLAAFTAVNLVGPIEGVEGAFNPDMAAGGADPESAASVAGFAPARLRMRGRIITLRDAEQAALDFSNEWVQARALQRGNRVALVGVARGDNPVPGQAQRRALEQHIAAQADPLLAARIDVSGPRLWPFALALNLTVPTLDAAGAVGSNIEAALDRWFDAARGGPDGTGIPLGAPIEADDIAFALLDVEDLEHLDSITLQKLDEADQPTGPTMARADLPDDALPRLIALNLKFTVSAEGVA